MAHVVSDRALGRPRPEPYVPRHRFGVAYLALGGILAALVGLLVVLTTRGATTHRTAAVARWSAWQPTTTGTLGVREIAGHVAPEYRLNGGQLTGVLAGPMELPSPQGPVPVSALLISSGSAGVVQARIDVAYPQAGVFYQLCGQAAACEPAGRPSARRGELLTREAIELGLYTFHYLPQTDYVLAFLPPQPGVSPNDPRFHRAIFLSRTTLATQIASPLTATLPTEKAPITPASLTARDVHAIDGLAAGRVFHYVFQQAPDNSALVVLSPIEP